MADVTLSTFWDQTNDRNTAKWIAYGLYVLLETGNPPSVEDLMARFGVSQAVAHYIIAYSLELVTEIKKFDPDVTVEKLADGFEPRND